MNEKPDYPRKLWLAGCWSVPVSLAILLFLYVDQIWGGGLFRLFSLPLYLLSSNVFLLDLAALTLYLLWRLLGARRWKGLDGRVRTAVACALLAGAVLLIPESCDPLMFAHSREAPVLLLDDLWVGHHLPLVMDRSSVLLRVTHMTELAEGYELRCDCRFPWMAEWILKRELGEANWVPAELGFDEAYRPESPAGQGILLRQGNVVVVIYGFFDPSKDDAALLTEHLELEVGP